MDPREISGRGSRQERHQGKGNEGKGMELREMLDRELYQTRSDGVVSDQEGCGRDPTTPSFQLEPIGEVPPVNTRHSRIEKLNRVSVEPKPY